MYKGAIVGLGNVALNGHVPGWKSSSEFHIVAGVDPHVDRRIISPRHSRGVLRA